MKLPRPRKQKASLKLDIETALAFIDSMGVDRATATWFLQFRKNKRVRQLIGCDPDTLAELRRLHDQEGYRVSVMLQKMSGMSRKTCDVLSFDVVSLDFDGGLPECWLHNIRPTKIIETSSGHFHAHWRLSDPLSVQQGESLMRAMARAYKSDQGAAKCTQPFRVPGSYNQKHDDTEPFLVATADGGTEELVSIEAILVAFPDHPIEPVVRISNGGMPQSYPDDCIAKHRDLVRMLTESSLRLDTREEWRRTGEALNHISNGADWAFDAWHTISQRSNGYVSEGDCRKEWAGFGKKGTGNLATEKHLYSLAKECGCDLSEHGRKYPSGQSRAPRSTGPSIRPGHFSMVSNARFGSLLWTKLSLSAKELYDLICDVCGPWKSTLSFNFIQRRSGLKKPTIRRAIEELKDASLIVEYIPIGPNSHGQYSLPGSDPVEFWATQSRVEAKTRVGRKSLPALNRNGFHKAQKSRRFTDKYVSLSKAAKELYRLACAMHYDGNNGNIRLSVEFVALNTGLSKNAVMSALQELKRADLIGLVPGKRGGGCSIVTVHEYGTQWDEATSKYLLQPKTDWEAIRIAEKTNSVKHPRPKVGEGPVQNWEKGNVENWEKESPKGQVKSGRSMKLVCEERGTLS